MGGVHAGWCVAVKRLSLVSLLALGAAEAATAQAPPAATEIQPDASLGTAVSRAGTTYIIDGGRVAGANLFHSFADFDLASGDTAQWVHSGGNPAALANVINRVTGGDPSDIFGTLDSSAIPNADFYFINPAGIVFGDEARVDVPAAAHFSTARELRFASGPAFQTATPDGSTLSVAAPSAFGFIGGEGAILLSGLGGGFLANRGTLSLAAADNGVDFSGFSSGGLALVAVGGGDAEIGTDGRANGPLAGIVALTDSTLLTGARPGAAGEVRIATGTLALDNSQLSALAGSNRPGGDVTVTAELVLLTNAELSTLSASGRDAGDLRISTGTLDALTSTLASDANGTANAGSIAVTAADVVLTKSAIASSSTGSGDSGAVGVQATGAFLSDGSYFSAAAFGSGSAADIGIRADTLTLVNSFVGAEPSTSGSPGAGSSGNIVLEARLLAVGSSTLTTSTTGSANAGNILLLADGVDIADSVLSSDSFNDTNVADPGAAGNVLVNGTETLFVTNSSLTSEAVCSGSGCATGNAGLISLAAADVAISRSFLTTDVGDEGLSGGILVEADDGLDIVESEITSDRGLVFLSAVGDTRLTLTNISAVNSGTGGQQGGAIFVGGRNVTLESSRLDAANFSEGTAAGSAGLIIFQAQEAMTVLDSDLLLETFGTGDAGSLLLIGNSVALTNSTITSASLGDGNGGAVLIESGSVSLANSAIDTSSDGPGQAGLISISATDGIDMSGASEVTSSTSGSGSAGIVSVTGQSLVMSDASFISSSTFAGGNAGGVFVDVADVLLQGPGTSLASQAREGSTGRAGIVSVTADVLTIEDDAFINSSTFASGNAGTVIVDAGTLTVSTSGQIDSATEGTGNAGSVEVTADTITIDTTGQISSSTFAAGAAGDVSVEADSIRLAGGGNIASQAGIDANGVPATGTGGTVDIRAQTLLVEDDGYVDASTFGPGDAGLLFIDAQSVTVRSGGLVTSRTLGGGDAGGVQINAGSVTVDGGSISSSALDPATGAPGGVFITAADAVTVSGGGAIDTASNNPNPAGIVFVSAPQVTVTGDDSRISSANLFESGPCEADQCAAGEVTIETLGEGATLSLLEGGRITTNSQSGPAGDIALLMGSDSLLILEGRELPGIIETSSGPGTGGVITISAPRAIISNGARIRALGESGGANVRIDTQYFIASADRLNLVEVDGDLVFSNAIYDVSAGTVNPDLSVLDASGVLRGQCPAVRSSGQLSEFTVREVGPYAPAEPAPDGGEPITGDCL